MAQRFSGEFPGHSKQIILLSDKTIFAFFDV
jgi:hypothetical protein